MNAVAAHPLRSYVEQIERREDARRVLGEDIEDIYAKAKNSGFDVKIIRVLVSLRAQESAAATAAQEFLFAAYQRAMRP